MNRWTAYVASNLLAFVLVAPAAGQTHFDTIYTFTNGYPVGLTASSGELYGAFQGLGSTGIGCGVVFELQPPPTGNGAWPEAVLYSFGEATTDACDPAFTPIFGADGALYGTAVAWGGYGLGALYQLQPPAFSGGSWTESTPYSFPAFPASGPVLGPRGSIYVLNGDNELMQLAPPSAQGGNWTGTVLYNFPFGTLVDSLIEGTGGVLYGTSEFGGLAPGQRGEVFELKPPSGPGGAWAYQTLHSFGYGNGDAGNPNSLTLASDGTIYGTTYGASITGGLGEGAVFELTPPASPGAGWAYTILKNFGGLHLDSPLILRNGSVYGALASATGGAVFELQPPSTAGASWTLVFLHNFTNGQVPFGQMVMDQRGVLYGATGITDGQSQSGTVYQIETQ